MNHGYDRWARIRSKIDAFKSLTRDDTLYYDLIKLGINSVLLNNWLDGPRTRKKTGGENDPLISLPILMRMGGKICGSTALTKYLKLDLPTKDIDIFFDYYPAWIQAYLIAWSTPNMDVCLYEKIPWEGFDLTPSKLFLDESGFSVSDECQKALDSNVCSIDFESVIHARATLGRACKYARKYNFQLLKHEIDKLVRDWKITNSKMIEEAYTLCK